MTSLIRYVQRFLKARAEVTNQTSQAALVRRIEQMVDDLEESLQHEFEHISNSLVAQRDETSRKFKYIVAAVDRAARGEIAKSSQAGVQAMKEAVRAPINSPPATLRTAPQGGGGGGGPGGAAQPKRMQRQA